MARNGWVWFPLGVRASADKEARMNVLEQRRVGGLDRGRGLVAMR